jgi:hypothetical protein
MQGLKRITVALAIVLFTSAAGYAQTGVAGDWELTLNTPQGANTVNVSVKQDGEKITGTLTSPMGSVPFTGTAIGDTVKVVAPLDIQGQTLELSFDAKISGNTLDGKVKLGDFGEFPFTGKRASAAAASTSSPAGGAAVGATTASNAAGKWDIVLSIPGAGDFPMTATLTQAGQDVAGTIDTQAAGIAQVKGTMTGATLKLEFTAQSPQGAIPITMNGTLGASGLAGKADIAGMGQADWTGKRAQ